MENDIDPDIDFFCNVTDSSCYPTEEQYNETIKTVNRLSIIHFSCRGLYENFIISRPESWINPDKIKELWIRGIKSGYKSRQKPVIYHYIVLECLTEYNCREKRQDKNKDIIISCIYIVPRSSIASFGDWMEEGLADVSWKVLLICGS